MNRFVLAVLTAATAGLSVGLMLACGPGYFDFSGHHRPECILCQTTDECAQAFGAGWVCLDGCCQPGGVDDDDDATPVDDDASPDDDDDTTPADDDASPDDDDDFGGGFLVYTVTQILPDDDASPPAAAGEADGATDDDHSPGQPWEAWIGRADAPMAEPTVLSKVTGYNAIQPVVSPDGATVVFSANYDDPHPLGTDMPGGNLFKMSANGGQPARVTSDDWSTIYEAQPSFSPDGSKLAYTRVDSSNGSPLQYLSKIYLTDLSGADPHPAIPDDAGRFNETDPVFSPDGTKLAFTSGEFSQTTGGANEIMLEDLSNPGTPTRLTNTLPEQNTSSRNPFFDASGNWVYYMAATKVDELISYAIYRVPAAGGDPAKVFDIPSVDLPWSLQAPEYVDFATAYDFTHAACIAALNDAWGVATIDSLGAINPVPVTDRTDYILFVYWYRPSTAATLAPEHGPANPR